MSKSLLKRVQVGVEYGTKTKQVSITGGYSYILDCFSISVYVLNRTLHDIHDNSDMFFILAPVNSLLYHMLILIHLQHLVVDGIVLCIITDDFAHHVSYRFFFFIISFSPTSIHYVVYHYHIHLFGCNVAVNFVSLVSSSLHVAAQLDFVLVLVFTALYVIARLSYILVLDLCCFLARSRAFFVFV